MDKLLTISIANYNNADKLNRCLSSLIDEKIIDELDIIIVNDGSKDNSKEIILDFVNRYPNSIKLVDKDNGGYGSTINASLKYAEGKYYKLLDADDYFDNKELKKLLGVIKVNDVDIIYNNFNFIKGDKIELKDFPYPQNKILDISILDDIHMHALTVKTSLIKDKISITENSYYVDIEFAIKCMEYSSTFLYLPLNIYQYNVGDVSQSVSRAGYIKHAYEHEAVIKTILLISHSNNKFKNLNAKHLYPLAADQLFIYMFDKKFILDYYRYSKWLKECYLEAYKKAKLYMKLASKNKFFYYLFSRFIKK